MWAARYFNPRYWAERYWPKVGAVLLGLDLHETNTVGLTPLRDTVSLMTERTTYQLMPDRTTEAI